LKSPDLRKKTGFCFCCARLCFRCALGFDFVVVGFAIVAGGFAIVVRAIRQSCVSRETTCRGGREAPARAARPAAALQE
jgi:hypothetical protein